MVDTGGRTGIAIAGLVIICIMLFLLYHAHQTNKPQAPPGSARSANRAEVDTYRQSAASRGISLQGTDEDPNQPTLQTASTDVENQAGAPEGGENQKEEEEKEKVQTSQGGDATPAAESTPENDPESGPMTASTKEVSRAKGKEVNPPPSHPTPEEISKEEEEKKEIEELRTQLRSITVPDDDEIQGIFDEIDHNQDGSISMPEVEKAMIQRKAEFNLKPAIVLRAFHKTDTDSDGKISREEFFRFIRLISYYKNLSSVFDAMDTDHNRRLNKDEFSKAAHVLGVEDPDVVFQEMDENKGGYIVFDEFCIWMAEKRHDEDAF